MRVLLDTHTLLWAALNPERLSAKAKTLLTSLNTEAFVSAASAWEIATKVRIGKLPGAGAFAADFPARIERMGFYGLAITLEHGQRAGLLPGGHKDPFDRMLIAQAFREGLTIVTHDKRFSDYNVAMLPT